MLSDSNEPSLSDKAAVTRYAQRPLLVIFVHGFKGTDQTFGEFPDRLQHILTDALTDMQVNCIIFPAYETKGDLKEAVVRFADWLTTLSVEKEVASGGGAGKAKIVLCGHSMGGLLIADALLEFYNSRPDKTCPLWPNIVACLAFDTPFLGIHPHVFKNSVTKAADYVTAARTVGSAFAGALAGLGANKATPSTSTPTSPAASSPSGWAKWAAPAAYAIGGAVLAGATAGSAYYKREELGQGFTWATDHLKYVGNLWDEAALTQRVDALIGIEKQAGVIFRAFYTLIPATPPFSAARMFVVLPKRVSPQHRFFLPAKNSLAPDELQAHTGMFGAKTNDGYYELGLAAANLIRESLQVQRDASQGGDGSGQDKG